MQVLFITVVVQGSTVMLNVKLANYTCMDMAVFMMQNAGAGLLLYLTSNEGKSLLLPLTCPALGCLYHKRNQFLHSLCLFQKCYEAGV